MSLPRVLKRTSGFSLVELLLILAILTIVLSGIVFYIINFTSIGDGLNRTSNSDLDNAVKVVDIPKPSHNQIVINLSDEPLQLSSLEEKERVLYSFFRQVAIGTEWPKGNAGVLVLSYDKLNVKLLGYRYVKSNKKLATSGLDALSNLDANGDGKLNKIDIDYRNLYVWLDENRNGLVDSDELKSLDELGIIELDLRSFKSLSRKVVGRSSVITSIGNYVREDGAKGNIFDVNLFQDPYFREFAVHLSPSDDALLFPDAVGAGFVRDLMDAVTLNVKLVPLLNNYFNTSLADKRYLRMDEIMYEWAKTAKYFSLEKDVQASSFSRYRLGLQDSFLPHSYATTVTKTQETLKKIMIIESFTARKLLYLSTQEILNVSTHRWELHVVISYGVNVIGSHVFLANKSDVKRNILLTEDMIEFSDEQIIAIDVLYDDIKKKIFEHIQKATKQPIKKQDSSGWIDPTLQKQIETGEIYFLRQQQQKKTKDYPHRRHISECMKPGNIVDQQVKDCAIGKISKTW